MIKEDVVQTRIEVDGKQAISQLGKLEMEAKQLAIDMRSLKKGSDEYVKASEKLSTVFHQLEKVRNEADLSSLSLKQLRNYQKSLNSEIQNLVSGTDAHEKLRRRIVDVNQELTNQQRALRPTRSLWSQMRSEFMAFAAGELMVNGLTEIVLKLGEMVKGAGDLDDKFADVQKTTGLTRKEVLGLAKDLKKINTRSSRSELLGLAKIAGKLGIEGKQNIFDFVEAADKINVALGEDLGDVETVMRELGKLTETFNIKKTYGQAESLMKVGSAINTLGAKSSANEAYLVEFTKRMGGIAPLAKISIQDILGLGAALDNLGQTSEVSSTAVSRILVDMSKRSDAFAQYARNVDGSAMSTAEFAQLLSTDANAALLSVLEGVSQNSNGMLELSKTLGDMGEDGGRVIGVLGVLADKLDLVKEQQRIANAEFKKGTSIISEFDIKNNTLGAKLDRLGRKLKSVFVNQTVIDGISSMVSWMDKMLEVPLAEKIEDERVAFDTLALRLMRTNEGSQERVDLLNKLKKQYPEHLANLNTEKVSNEQLGKVLKTVNAGISDKIRLMLKQEKLTLVIKRQETLMEQQNQIYANADKSMSDVAKKYGINLLELEKGMTQAEQLQAVMDQMPYKMGQRSNSQAQWQYNRLRNYAEKMEEIRLQLKDAYVDEESMLRDMEKMNGFNTPEQEEDTSGGGAPSPVIDTVDTAPFEEFYKELQALYQEFNIGLLTSEEQKYVELQNQWEGHKEKLLGFYEEGIISEKEYKASLKLINQLYQDEVGLLDGERIQREIDAEEEKRQKKLENEQAVQDLLLESSAQLDEARATEEEAEILRLEAHYKKLEQKAKEHGATNAQIQQIEGDKIAAVKTLQEQQDLKRRLAYYDTIGNTMSSLGQLSAGLAAFQGKQGEEMSQFQKSMVIAQITFDTVGAISSAIRYSEENMANGITGGLAGVAVFAVALGRILSNVAMAKQTLSGAGKVDAPEAKVAPKYGRTSAQAYYSGGFTGDKDGLGFGDQYGEYKGYVHKNEYVMSEKMLENPIVMNAVQVAEAIKGGNSFYDGGSTSPNTTITDNPTTFSSDEVLIELRLLRSDVQNMKTNLTATISKKAVDNNIQDFNDSIELENSVKL